MVDASGYSRKVSIRIGGVFASREPALVRTVLGSCVAACLYDPDRRIGGMNHFLLPDSVSDEGTPTRLGVHAMETLINDILKLGGDHRALRAKVFGGGHVLRVKRSDQNPGERNVHFVRRFLLAENIPIAAECLGGDNPLQVYFFTDSARTLIKRLGSGASPKVASEEGEYKTALVRDVQNGHMGEVDLF
jgi:chemotaxis receptor (MCP) glutamine deamidase CheD